MRVSSHKCHSLYRFDGKDMVKVRIHGNLWKN